MLNQCKMKVKDLTNSQARTLFEDILENDVKRYGYYAIGSTLISIRKNTPSSNSERVKRFYKNNPEKLKATNLRRKKMYHIRRKRGVCVRCGRKTKEGYVWCPKHHREHNKQQRVRKKQSSFRNEV